MSVHRDEVSLLYYAIGASSQEVRRERLPKLHIANALNPKFPELYRP